MCGICGFAGKGSDDDLARMTRLLAHRGPDADGFWMDRSKKIFLGHRRLSVLDISGGSQPMFTEDGSLGIVFNGEIYNFRELRSELESAGHVFFTDHSDTEVVLRGFMEWGEGLPEKLNGMWAFALMDRRNNQLFLSRDRFGKKPLFYSVSKNFFVFSSELASLVSHSEVNKEISRLSLKKYFAYGYIPAPSTIYRNIHKLPGGSNLKIDLGSFYYDIKSYWRFVLEPFENIPENPEDVWCEELRHLIGKAVKRRLVSDVPLGVFLSGGIDSTSVAAFSTEILGRGNVETFSIGFREKSFDESDYAQLAASSFGTSHNLSIISMDSASVIAPMVANRLDEPMGDSSIIPTFLLCREARKKVTVALGGDGADELFAGYDPFKALYLADLYKKIVPKPVHEAIRMLAGMLPVSHQNMSLDFRLKRTLRGLSYSREIWNSVWLGTLDPSELEYLFSEPSDLEEIYEEAINSWESCTQADIASKTLQFYTDLYLQDDILVKTDRASMMNSLEVRAPYLDIELVDFVRRIPTAYKFRNGTTKYILKKALEPILPKEILYRPKKGFGAPVGQWIRNGFINLHGKNRLDEISVKRLSTFVSQHMQGSVDQRAFLWNYWICSLFMKRHGKK